MMRHKILIALATGTLTALSLGFAETTPVIAAPKTCRGNVIILSLPKKFETETDCLNMEKETGIGVGEFALRWLIFTDGVDIQPSEKIHFTLTGLLTLEDMAAGMSLECVVTGLGVFEAEGVGQQETFEPTSCKTVKGFCGAAVMEPLNLPWSLETLEEERILIAGGTGGEPGYKVTCSGIILDSCTGVTSMAIENMPLESPADMLEVFSATLSEAENCSVGGSAAGLIIGEELTAALEGLSLSYE